MTIQIDERITLEGAPGSPYTRKMLAVLRYRQIPYRFLHWGASAALGWAQPKVRLLPIFYFADEDGKPTPVTDSSPLIQRLESLVSGRSVIPPDPVMAMINMLLEDYADEWLTKAMFHYRWQYEEDIQRASDVLPHWRAPAQPDSIIAQRGREFRERQISRLVVVGSNAITGPVIEQSYQRLIHILNGHLSEHRFLMGARPGSCDFSFFGQLTCLAQFDPTPMALTLAEGGRIYAWVSAVEDLSGEDPAEADWVCADQLPPTLRAILSEMGRTYVPVMLANERAVDAAADLVSTQVDGLPWEQKPFPYQAKCVRWLREARNRLNNSDQDRFSQLIAGTDVDKLFV